MNDIAESNLYLGECVEVMLGMESNSIDYAFTSPPYNRKRDDKYENYRDVRDDWFQFNCDVIDQLMRICRKHVFYNVQANYYNREDVYKLIGKYAKSMKDIHIWEKSNPMPASGSSITNAVEYFFILGDEPLKSNETYTKNIITTSVNSKMPKNHKAVMKPEVAEHFIRKFTQEGDTVIDCFMGTGTTGVVCKQNGRNFIGIELNEEYYEDSKNNIENSPFFSL